MIDYRLRPCCNECNNLDLDYSQETLEGFYFEYQNTVIFCKHQIVCGKYNEVEYHSEVE